METWRLVAYLDRRGGARGALMRAVELGDTTQGVSAHLLAVPFPAQRLGRGWWGFAGVAASIVLLYAVEPANVAVVGGRQQQGPPLLVQRVSRVVDRLPLSDQRTAAFVESARRTLSQLASKSAGLSRSEFEALERIRRHSESLLRQRGDALALRRHAIASLEQVLATHESGTSTAGQGGTMAGELKRQRDLLERAGLSAAQIEQLLDAARKLAPDGDPAGDGEPGSPGHQGAFSRQASAALREAIGELRRLNAVPGATQGAPPGAEASGPGGSTEGSDGPPGTGPGGGGLTALELSGNTQNTGDPLLDRPFSALPSRQTVLLGLGRSQRGDPAVVDRGSGGARSFQPPETTRHQQRSVSPSHRAVLEVYFGGEP
jgi:hypothetical protein